MTRIKTLAHIAQMADKEDMWISKQEWEEQGTRALEKLGAR
jgi:actin-related protein 2